MVGETESCDVGRHEGQEKEGSKRKVACTMSKEREKERDRVREWSAIEKGWRVAGESAVPSLREGCEGGREDGHGGVERWRRTAVATAVEAHEHHFY